MKLSIIIPVFKVEEYLAICLDSILIQGFSSDEFEVIIINDGSPDKSKEIALEYTAKHPNFIFIDQENQGVSVARSAGIDAASGEYIAFIDPDDSIYPNSLKPILKRAYDDDLDILYLSLDVFDENGTFIQHIEKSGDDNEILDGFSHPRRTFLSTLYKRSVIGDIRYRKNIIRGQDTVFNTMVQSRAKRCSYSSIPYYKYLERTSSSRQFIGTERNFVSLLLAIETIHEFQKEYFPDQTASQKRYFDDAMLIFVQRTLEWIILPQRNEDSFNRLKDRLRELNLGYLIAMTSKRFPMFDKPFRIFIIYRKLSGYLQGLMYKFAKK